MNTDGVSNEGILNSQFKSLYTGELPTEWTQVNVELIFKKGSTLQAVNYRPLSLSRIDMCMFLNK